MRPLLLRRLRAVAVTSAAVATTLSLLPGLSAARTAVSRPTEPAEISIAAIKADVARTNERLAAAVTAYEQGQVRLGHLLNLKVESQRSMEQLQLEADEARARVSSLAGDLYRNPVDPTLYAALTGSLRTIADVRLLQQRERHTVVDQRKDAELLTTEIALARELVEQQDDAASAAIRLQSQLDDQLTALQADANATAKRLQDALAELRRREAEAAAAALGTGDGATCATDVPADAVNGMLPISALCPLQTAPGQRLARGAAEAFDAMSRAYAAATGDPLCVTDSYRDYQGQLSVFARKPSLAATPGRSLHGWGVAVDLCGGVQSFGTPAYLWLKENAVSFGFHHPSWAEPGGGKPEPWHWEYEG